MNLPGDRGYPLRVAVVGAGPSGFYACEALLRSQLEVAVDLYEKLPAPYGLVRYGVAPDHAHLKSVTRVFERIATTPGLRLRGNLNVGRDVMLEELADCYHAVILATGVEYEKQLDIPGEDLPGSHSARSFVAWYNGHPDYRDCVFDLSNETAVIVGQGNVALDVARILAKSADELRNTDISAHALEQLAESRVRDLYIVGRRGPAQAKFTAKELREFGTFSQCAPVVSPEDLVLNEQCAVALSLPANQRAKSIVETLAGFEACSDTSAPRRCHFLFNLQPHAILGKAAVAAIAFQRTRLEGPAFAQRPVATGQIVHLECGLVIRSIGYRRVKLPRLPRASGVDASFSQDGRILEQGRPIPGMYAVGWIKRGAEGTIGTNRGDSVATVAALLEDRAELPTPCHDVNSLLERISARGVRLVDFTDWERIDRAEVARGQPLGKPREKFTTVDEMLQAAAFPQVGATS